ncbi:MAG: hypothetical protein ACRENJ_07765 [Candidatus Eiseniibacteriota bacterium]
MKTQPGIALTLPLVIALLAGCSRQGTLSGPQDPGTGTDEAEVASALAAEPSYVDDEVSESADQTTLEASASPASGGAGVYGTEAAIRPLGFWRQIRSVERKFEFAFADTDTTGRPTTAIVTVHKFMLGSFNILVGDEVPEGSPPQAHVIHKPLADHGVRRLLLKRVPAPDATSRRGVWRVVATSGVRITSRGAATRIESLRVQSGPLDTTITEPLAFFRLRAIIKLDPLADVTLTATTLRNDDVVLLYLRDRRVRFHNNGDNTYSARFRVPDRTGLHHVGVNALSNGTLFDDVAPYDSQSWIEPYLVHPLQLAEGTPAD